MSLKEEIQSGERDLERERINIGFDEEICYNYKRVPENEEKFSKTFYKYTGKNLFENDFVNLKLLKIYAAEN